MKFRSKHAVLSLFVAAALGGVVLAEDAAAQSRGSKKSQGAAEQLYPQATRKEPATTSSRKAGKNLQKMLDAFNEEDYAQARSLADQILATEGTNDYDRALAAQVAAQAAYSEDDSAAAKAYLEQVLQYNGLDNNGHYQSMLMLAQLHLADDEVDQGLAVLDRYLSETQSSKPQDLVLKGQALYQAERYQEAIPVLKQAVESPEARDNWVQLLMACYVESGQHGEAIALAERLVAKNPGDKKAQTNLATVYAQAERMDKAAEVLEKLRAAGQLSEEREYRQLYVTYANMEGREKDVIAVINEGLQKGLLKPDYQTYLALAQSYYYSEQIPQAIENWQKAAPLSKDGETYLNLARVLYQEGRVPEAKQAAQQALAKGVRKPEDARKIINLK